MSKLTNRITALPAFTPGGMAPAAADAARAEAARKPAGPGDQPDLSLFAKAERLTRAAQTKLTPTELAILDDFVEWANGHGAPGTTRSSAIRTFVLSGLNAYRREVTSRQDVNVTS